MDSNETALTLPNINNKLKTHYNTLMQSRGGAHLYAIEHNLTDDEVRRLQFLIKLERNPLRSMRKFPLLWIVYACEIGYNYDGEYWPLFEQNLFRWRVSYRENVRQCFVDFSQQYRGAQPEGLFADHFSIIAWPILHAIIPKDFQYTLVNILRQIQFQSNVNTSDFISLGALIARNSENESERFRFFVRQIELIGMISSALLTRDETTTLLQDNNAPISQIFLDRIQRDINLGEESRQWLQEARRETKSRLMRERVRKQQVLIRIGARPSNQNSPQKWGIFIEIADLRNLENLDITQQIENSRCIISSTVTTQRPLARGACLGRTNQVFLHTWPQATEQLIQFDPAIPELELILNSQIQELLRNKSRWLFLLDKDNEGTLLANPEVHSNATYLLIVHHNFEANNTYNNVILNTANIKGILLSLPNVIEESHRNLLHNIGIPIKYMLKVEPFGIATRTFNNMFEWLYEEPRLLSIVTDLECDSFVIDVKSQNSGINSSHTIKNEHPTLVSVPWGIGESVSLVVKCENRGVLVQEISPCRVEINTYHVLNKGTGSTNTYLLDIVTLSNQNILEEVFSDVAQLEVRGPIGYPVTCRIKLYDLDDCSFFTKILSSSIDLPILPEKWSFLIESALSCDEKLCVALDQAEYGVLNFVSEEIGETFIKIKAKDKNISLVVEKDEHSGNKSQIRILTKNLAALNHIDFYSAFSPIDKNVLEISDNVIKSPKQGMFIVRPEGGNYYNALASIYADNSDNSDNKVELVMDIDSVNVNTLRKPHHISKLLDLTHLWSIAETGFDKKRRLIKLRSLKFIANLVSFLIGGRNWRNAEKYVIDNNNDDSIRQRIDRIKELIVAITDPGLAMQHIHVGNIQRFAEQAKEERITTFVSTAVLLGCSNSVTSRWCGEFALRLASSPASVSQWASASSGAVPFHRALQSLMDDPVFWRLARWYVLAVEQYASICGDDERAFAANKVYKGWSWK